MLHSLAYSPNFQGSSRALAFEAHDSSRASLFCATSQDAPPLASETLLKGQKIVEIVHNGSLYKLQATKLGKLILTK